MRWIKPLILTCSFLALSSGPGCPRESNSTAGGKKEGAEMAQPKPEDDFARKRGEMVRSQIEARGVKDPLALGAMRKVPRHLFVAEKYWSEAYDDHPLPIGSGQTISQPYIVALMTEQLALKGGDKVLEIGTGSGYQAAALAEIAGEVYTIEIICPLADAAKERLQQMGYINISVKCGDGYRGWPEQAPFDAIIVTAAPDKIPQPLLDQLKPGGRMVIPVGGLHQELILIRKKTDGTIEQQSVIPVRFVPMTGEAEK